MKTIHQKVTMYAIPDCNLCDKVEKQLRKMGILPRVVYDIKAKGRVKELGKCSEQPTCDFIKNQRKVALQESGAAPTTKYPILLHNNHYIPLEGLENYDFSLTAVSIITEPAVVIYTANNCWSCYRAKELLRKKNISFIEKDRMEDPHPERCGQELSSAYPKIYINDQCIGGYNELKQLDGEGKLTSYVEFDNEQPKLSTRKSTAANKSSTQPNLSPSNEVVISASSSEALLSLLKPTKGVYQETMEAFKLQKFKLWLDTQEGHINQLLTPKRQLVAKLVIDSQCPFLLIEEMLRQGLALNTTLDNLSGDTVRAYLTKRCSAKDYRVGALLRYYSKKNVSNSHQMPAFNEVIKEKEASFADRKQNSWPKTAAFQAIEGGIQGGIAFAIHVFIKRLQCLQPIRSLPFWLRWLIPTLVYSFVQASVSLTRYPILGQTILEDESEEAAEAQVLLSALATYFLANLTTGIPLGVAIEGLRKVINDCCENHPRLRRISLAFVSYLGALSNLPSLLLSQATYWDMAGALGGFAVNVGAWIVTYAGLNGALGTLLLPPPERVNAEEGEPMVVLNNLPSGRFNPKARSATPFTPNTVFAHRDQHSVRRQNNPPAPLPRTCLPRP